MPEGQKAPEGGRVHRGDLPPQPGQGALAKAPQHLGIAPLGERAPGADLPAHQGALPLQKAQHRLCLGRAQTEACCRLGGREGAAGAGEAAQQAL